jgi:hypothetical protein
MKVYLLQVIEGRSAVSVIRKEEVYIHKAVAVRMGEANVKHFEMKESGPIFVYEVKEFDVIEKVIK